MIAIGNHFGGPEQRGALIHKMLNKAMNIAADVSEPNYDDGTEAWVNPIFLVHGSMIRPDFEGYELGHFSKKEKGLVVKIAVPQSVADGEGIPEFIGISLREAVRLAAAHFASKGISFSTLKAEKIILAIESGLQQISA
jgi:hypothetical protein